VQHSHTKHIVVCHNFIRDHVAKGDIDLMHVGTNWQLADIFTKPLDVARFCKLRNKINIIDPINLVWPLAPYIFLHYIVFRGKHQSRGSVFQFMILYTL
jgi:hypothetical protein